MLGYKYLHWEARHVFTEGALCPLGTIVGTLEWDREMRVGSKCTFLGKGEPLCVVDSQGTRAIGCPWLADRMNSTAYQWPRRSKGGTEGTGPGSQGKGHIAQPQNTGCRLPCTGDGMKGLW